MSDEQPQQTAPGDGSDGESRETPTRTEIRAKQVSLLDADGRERPPFLLGFPRDPELRELSAAFERGDFALVRKRALQLAESTQDQAVKAAALELLRRTQPDPLVQLLLLMAIGLFLFLVGWTYIAH